MDIVGTVSGAWNAFATKIGAFLPSLFVALGILAVGWIVCNIIKKIVIRLLKLCQLDSLAEKGGVSAVLTRGGIQQTFTEILGILIFWFLFLIVIVATLDTVGLPVVTETIHTIFLYLPKMVAAIVLLILGLYLASFIETVTRTSCANTGLQQADSIARVAYYGTAVFVVAAILEILGIASEMVRTGFILVFGSICVALAIAFGIGGRDIAARYLEKWFENKDQ